MKVQELRDLAKDELVLKELEMEKQLMGLRFKLGTKQVDNPMKIRQTRRDIARIRTILRERELGIERRGKNA
jgi:large subunit ribosomal protein L29